MAAVRPSNKSSWEETKNDYDWERVREYNKGVLQNKTLPTSAAAAATASVLKEFRYLFDGFVVTCRPDASIDPAARLPFCYPFYLPLLTIERPTVALRIDKVHVYATFEPEVLSPSSKHRVSLPACRWPALSESSRRLARVILTFFFFSPCPIRHPYKTLTAGGHSYLPIDISTDACSSTTCFIGTAGSSIPAVRSSSGKARQPSALTK